MHGHNWLHRLWLNVYVSVQGLDPNVQGLALYESEVQRGAGKKDRHDRAYHVEARGGIRLERVYDVGRAITPNLLETSKELWPVNAASENSLIANSLRHLMMRRLRAECCGKPTVEAPRSGTRRTWSSGLMPPTSTGPRLSTLNPR